MAMALKSEMYGNHCDISNEKPLDLVHLSTQTMGDTALEKEVLSMFRNQSEIYLKMACNSCDATQRSFAAHALKGVARGIGAFRLAEYAREIEDGKMGDFNQLKDEVNRVNAYIDQLQPEA